MDTTKEIISLAARGVRDCLSGIGELLKSYLFAKNNELSRENVERLSVRDSHHQDNAKYKVKIKLYECFAFGIYFVLSDLLFDRFLLQSVFIQLVEWTGDDINATYVTVLQKILYVLFCILWILPLLCLSKFLNFNWYQDIANFVLIKSGHKKYEDIKMSDFYADQIKSIIVQMMYCVQGFAIYMCPFPWYVQYVYYIFHLALLSSLYSFEYKWVYNGWPLHRRLLIIAKKWPYYLGFGVVLAFINSYFSSFVLSLIVFATLFPVYVISSAVTQDSQHPSFRYPLNTFKFVDYLSDHLIQIIMKFVNMALGSS